MSCLSRLTVSVGVMAAAVAVHANESSLQVSGMIDLGVYRSADKQWNVGTIQRSHVQFTGTEALGSSGLTAFFKLSTRLEADTGALEAGGRPFWHDESTVGLRGAFGAIKFGRALDALYANDWNFDPWAYFDRVASPAWDLWHYHYPSDAFANSGAAEYGRIDNGIFYESPRVKGFGLSISGSPEMRAGDTGRPLGAALTYFTPAFSAMLSRSENSTGASDVFMGVKGRVRQVTLMAAYDVSKTANDASTARALTLGAQYSRKAWTFKGGWGRLKVDGRHVQAVTGASVLYGLSRRTSVYADLARKRYVDDDATVYGVGMAHSF